MFLVASVDADNAMAIVPKTIRKAAIGLFLICKINLSTRVFVCLSPPKQLNIIGFELTVYRHNR